LLKAYLYLFFFLLTYQVFGANKIEMVFVSNFIANASDNKVLLSWKNPENFGDYITIFRSNEVIDSKQKLEKSKKIAVLKANEEKYIDEILPGTNNYYAVLITSKMTGKNMEIFIPYRNFNSAPAISVLDSKKDDVFEITKCVSTSNKTSVIFEWDYKTDSLGTAKAVIYRNLEPISDENKLGTSIKLNTISIDSKIFVDVPITGINYYYAIFLENDPKKKFVQGVTYTANPVSIEKKESSIDDFSSDNFIPLPLLTLQNDPTNGKRFNDPQILKNPQKIDYTKANSEIIKRMTEQNRKQYDEVMLENSSKSKKLEFKFLSDEDIYNAGDYSSDYENIINLLKKKDFARALDIINEMIYETIPEEIKARIAYYGGLIYYMNEDYYRSYLDLILSYDDYTRDVSPYIDSIYFIIFPTLDR
jgi:hypothetical protein